MLSKPVIFIGVLLVIALFCSAVLSLHKEDEITNLTVATIVGPRDTSEFGPRWAVLHTADGKRTFLQRAEFFDYLKGSEEVWQNLAEGQEVTLHHHFKGWKIWDNVITLSHRDSLVARAGSNK
ncbi:MAG: hypothetical protein HYW88_01800 [Candidatus Sungbacteria bacterium]|nr:hypothetical protein [Candidatus Sungbacteria bacterium]